MSKRTLVIVVLILGVVFLAKGTVAKPSEKAVPAYQIQQQDQGVETFNVENNVSKI